MNEKELEFEDLNLEDIMKEFGGVEENLSEGEENTQEAAADLEELLTEVQEEEPAPEAPFFPEFEEEGEEKEEEQLSVADLEPEKEPEAESAEATPEEPAVVVSDTVRLEQISHPEEEKPAADDELDMVEDFIPPAPIPFRPRSRLKDLKRQLIAGPEKRYYELSEMGLGKLQMAIFLCLIVILVSAGAAIVYSAGLVPQNRMRLMVFGQVLAMLCGALLGSYQMIEGVTDLVRGKFSLNTMLVVTFLACCADSVFCLIELRVPICAAFTLEVLMSLWAAYNRRVTEMGEMDTMRKAIRLDSVVKADDYHEGCPGFLRGEGNVENFMENCAETTGPEKKQNVYAMISLVAAVAVAVLAAVLHGVSMGVQILSTTLLVAVPASFFVSTTRPKAILESRLHSLGTVICGWQGVKGLCRKGVYPLRDADLFPVGSVKLNGVKFYGKRDPEETISYTTALMRANGGTLAPIFVQLLESRSGIRYEAYDLQYYGNGGIGGLICDEPVLMGTLDFLKEMGVEIPDGVQVRQAVYVAIDGELSGLFAISYNRMKYASNGLAAICGCRSLTPVMLAEDFMLTDSFLKEKFGVKTRRMVFPTRQERDALAAKIPAEDAPVLAMTTQDGLAPAVLAITGARALNTACKLGLIVHMVGGILGILIMAALAIVGAAHLLEPIHILVYQLIWMVPGLLVTLWPRTI